MSVAETPAGRALRAIQKYDEVTPADGRHFLLAAEDELGRMLGLECTGEREDGAPFLHYSHNGDNCPIHEWLVESDQKEAKEWLNNR